MKTKYFARAFSSFLFLAWALLCTSGCSDSGESRTASTSGSSTESQKVKLAGIIFQEDQFFRLILFGMRDAAKEAGAEFLESNSSNKPDREIELVNVYIARGVDAIVVSPLSKQGSVAALKLAHDKGITIVTYNTPVDGDLASTFVECSQEDLGAQTGKEARRFIEEKLNGQAKVAIVAFKSLVPEQSNARTDGFKKEIEELAGVQIVSEQDAWLPEMAVTKVGDILTANPGVNIIYAANEGGTIGAALAVKNAGKAGEIFVFGTDSSEQLLQMLQSDDDILQAVTSQRPVEIGRVAVESAIKASRNEPVEKVISLPGILLARRDQQGVKQFEQQLKEWMSTGK